MRFLLCCLIASCCFLCGADMCEYREYRIACAGDSLTTGNYPKILEKLLGDNAEVRVYARQGRSISSVNLDEVYYALRRWNPTHVVVYAGINDCLMGHHHTENSAWIIEHIENLIYEIQEANVEAVFVKHHPWAGYREYGYDCSLGVNEWLDGERFAYDPATVVETSSLGGPFGRRLKKEYDAGDGLHLSYEGEKVLAQLIAEAIK